MIWYSHINEDSNVERAILANKRWPQIHCIAGSGERFIALLDIDCPSFCAVDINPDALMLLELKLAALLQLDVDPYLHFIGHHEYPRKERDAMYRIIRPQLRPETQAFWDASPMAIRKGILFCGHYEHFLDRIRPFNIGFLGKNFKRIFETGGDGFPAFPIRRWKILCRLFSARWTYQCNGNRDTSFTAHNANRRLIPQGLNHILRHQEVNSSYVFHQLFKGHLRQMPPQNLPVSLQTTHLAAVRQRLLHGLKVEWVNADYLQGLRDGRITVVPGGFHSLSDIIGFTSPAYMQQVLEELLLQKDQVVVARSFLIHRFHPAMLDNMLAGYGHWKDHSLEESTHMYQVIQITS